jgi:hypothetical protein
MEKRLIDALAERIEGLERREGRWRLAAVFLALSWAVTVGIGAAATQPNTIRATHIVVVDSEGTERITLSAMNRPSVVLRDKTGKGRLSLQLRENEPSLGLFDADGKVRRLSLQLNENGPSLALFDPNGKVLSHFDASDSGGSGLFFGDPTKRSAGLSIGVAPETFLPSINMSDGKSKPRMTMGVTSRGFRLVVLDADGKLISDLPMSAAKGQ